MDKNKFLEIMKKRALEFGLTDEEFGVLNTIGYQYSISEDLFDMGFYKSAENVREAHIVTAEKKESLLKESYSKDLGDLRHYAVPSQAKFMLVVPIKNLLVVDDDNGSYVDSDGWTHKIFKKEECSIVLTQDFKYSFMYDFEVIIKLNTNLAANPSKYKMRCNYISNNDIVHVLDSDDILYKPIPIFMTNNADILTEVGESECASLVFDLYQFDTVIKNDRYYKTDNSSDVKSFIYDDMLADFDVMYRDLSTEDYRRIAKSLSFNNIKVSVETVFFKYTNDNTIAIMNRSFGNFVPTNNSQLKVEIYTTKGKSGSFTYSGKDIVFVSDNTSMVTKTYLLSQPNSGLDTPTVSELKGRLLLDRNIVGTLCNTKDFKKYVNEYYGEDFVNFRKSRHDNLELCFDVHCIIRDENNHIIPTNTLDVVCDIADIDNTTHECCPVIYSYEHGLGYDKAITEDESVAYHRFKTPHALIYNKNLNTVDIFDRFMNNAYETTFVSTNKSAEFFTIVNRLFIRKHPDSTPYGSFNLITSISISDDNVLHTYDNLSGTTLIDTGVCKVFAVFYVHGVAVGYRQCVMTEYDNEISAYKYNILDFTPNYYPKEDAMTLVLNRMVDGVEIEYLSPYEDISVELYVYKQDDTNVTPNVIYGMSDYTLLNRFRCDNINIFNNVTHIHKTNIVNTSSTTIRLERVPCIQYDYYKFKYITIHEQLDKHQVFMSGIFDKFFETSSVRLSFANSYGFGKRYKIGTEKQDLDNLGLSIEVNVKQFPTATADKALYIDFIVAYIRALDFKNGDTFHMAKMINAMYDDATIATQMEYIEHVSINGYASRYQLITLDTDVTEDRTDFSTYEVITPAMTISDDESSLEYNIVVNFI